MAARTAWLSGGGSVSLAISVSVLAVLWLVVLPWLGERPGVKSHLRWLDERGIDPSAMYYTELEAMEPILQRQQAAKRRASHPLPEPGSKP